MPKYTITFLPSAATDRDEIKAFLARYYESTAKRFFSLLRKKTERLKDFPFSCPVYTDDPTYRKLVVGDYLVFYVVREETKTVEIHRVLHGSRDAARHLS